jgi:outer membrane protein assembly factor BamB
MAPSRIIFFLLVGAACARAGDASWPEFRGPTGQGHSAETGLPLEWGPAKNVAWRKSIPGKGWSSPILGGGRIYLTTAVETSGGQGLSLRALSMDADGGEVIWDTEVFRHEKSRLPGIHSKNGHASPTPVLEGDRLYVHFGHLGTACLDASGKVLWRNGELDYPPAHGGGGSPIVAGEALIFSCDGASDPFVVALSKRSGKVLWRTPRRTDEVKKFSFSTPLLIAVDGKEQVVSPGSGAVCAYDPRTGKELWRVRYEGFSVVPRPVHGHGLIFLSTGYEEPLVLAIRPGGEGDVTSTNIAWSLRKGAPNTPSMLIVGDELYMVSDGGVATCVDAQSGKVHWQKRVCGATSASILHADGRIYLQDEDGSGVVLRPGRTFEKLAESSLDERTLASYAVGDGALFIRTEGGLYRIGG